ncbi:subtilisin-like protein [Trametes maxima]|nr:subtilisin-like protein [Trametes maxima]
MLIAAAFLVLVCLGSTVARPNPLAATSRTFRVHEARRAVPTGFTEAGPASPETTIKLRIALVQGDPSGVVDALYSVSDPDSSAYGQHLAKNEIEPFVAPTDQTKQVVQSWLEANGLTAKQLSPAGDWLGIEVPVSKANNLFDTTFSLFRDVETGAHTIRTLSYSLPEYLRSHVDLVYPTVSFPVHLARTGANTQSASAAYHSTVVRRDTSSTCANGTTPACLQELYRISRTPAVHKENRLGVTGFFGNSAHYAWLESFLKKFRPDMNPTTNFSVVGVDGGTNDQNTPSVSEGELDIQYTVGLATDIPVVYYFIGFDNQDGDLSGFLDEVNVLLALDKPPQVLTTSYGFSESRLSFALTDKLCRAYAQLGARGTTILYASGDSGVGCSSDSPESFQATFPSNCPFVTSVGGTQGFSPEEAWSGSSGGFSNYYARPRYQDDAVRAYLKIHGGANKGRFNASGRAFPDIAAKADNFRLFEVDSISPIYGTSAASPTVGSIIALLNDRLASARRPPLGFLNPWLYKYGRGAFTDITAGNSSIQCSENDTARGFDAVQGWDPVTGLGTPRFDKLLELLRL